MGSSPNWSYGFVPTAAQWNAQFAGKQDDLGYAPVNRAGDSMAGRLVTFGSTPSRAGFNISPGIAPNTPVSGDLWLDSAGLFVRVGSATVGPLASINGIAAGDVTYDQYGFATVADALDDLFGDPRLKLSGGTMTGALALSGDPTQSNEAATKQYVDQVAAGLNPKQSAKAATTADITLSGEQTIDGVSVVASDRVLVKNQTDAAENGIYEAAAGAWARTPDADTWDELVSAYLFVEEGTSQADTQWVCTVDSGGTLGVTPVTFVQYGAQGAVVRVDVVQSFTPAQQAQGRANISAALRGHIFGLTLSNNGSDATNDIDIAAGEAASDEASSVLMSLASAMTKRTDATWAVGSGNGGWLDGASMPNGTGHVFLIRRSDTGVVDVGLSASLSPTLPGGYDQKRRIGSILRESGSIVAFVQNGAIFRRSTPVADVNAVNPGTSAVTRTLSVPTGIVVEAIASCCLVAPPSLGTAYLSPLDATDSSPTTGGAATVVAVAGGTAAVGGQRIKTNTSAQIRSRISASDGSTNLQVATYGWIDDRGRFE